MYEKLIASVEESIAVKQALLKMIPQVAGVADEICKRFAKGKRFFVFGNGGSAADSQHLAAELVGKLSYPRPALPAVAFTTDTSILTAVGNDFGYDKIFSRQVEALAQEGDMVLGISTSGNSANVLNGLAVAKKKGCWTIGLTGKGGGKMKGKVDDMIDIPSSNTQRIQEGHLMVIHLLCERVEDIMFPQG